MRDALFSTLTLPQLLKVAPLSRESRDWVQAELLHAGGGDALGRAIRAADVAARIHVTLLRLFAAVGDPLGPPLESNAAAAVRGDPRGARVLLHPAVYALEGDEHNEAHLVNEPRGEEPEWDSDDEGEHGGEAHEAWEYWEPEWREGYGPLHIASVVTLVWQDGVQLAGTAARLEVQADGMRLVSIHFSLGLGVLSSRIALTMVHCTSSGEIYVHSHVSLAMEDCRICGSGSEGVHCMGMEAKSCTFEGNERNGMSIYGYDAQAKLVECVARNNRENGLSVSIHANFILVGGTIVATRSTAWSQAAAAR